MSDYTQQGNLSDKDWAAEQEIRRRDLADHPGMTAEDSLEAEDFVVGITSLTEGISEDEARREVVEEVADQLGIDHD